MINKIFCVAMIYTFSWITNLNSLACYGIQNQAESVDDKGISISVIALCVSVFAVCASAWAIWESRKSRTSSIFTELAQQANIINEAFERHDIPGPYHKKTRNKFGDGQESKKLEAIFFHHLNLLNIVYRNETYLSKEAKIGYKTWVKEVFGPWLQTNSTLLGLWKDVEKTGDLHGPKFMAWLKRQLPEEL